MTLALTLNQTSSISGRDCHKDCRLRIRNVDVYHPYSIVATGVKGDSSKVKFELFQQHGGDDIIYNTADCVNG